MITLPIPKRSSFVLLILFGLLNLTIVPIAGALPPKSLTEPEIQQQLTQLAGWTRQDSQLQRTFVWRDFVEAIAFVDRLVEPCEKLGHHPDILILYNQVTLTLTTHEAGGLTQKDFDLARIVSNMAQGKDKEPKIK